VNAIRPERPPPDTDSDGASLFVLPDFLCDSSVWCPRNTVGNRFIRNQTGAHKHCWARRIVNRRT
jgi:hypothetical protein